MFLEITSKTYRYGFNGKELDTEGMGGGLSTYDYGFRIYNPAIARFLSVDPITSTYPMLTPYQFASNTPIWAIDLDGLEAWISTNEAEKVMSHAGYQHFVQTTTLKLVNLGNVSDNQFDCANLLMSLNILYHKENGVRFNYVIAGERFDSSDPKWRDFEHFQERLWIIAGASNIREGELTRVIEPEEMEMGDLINSGGHAQIYLRTSEDPNDSQPIKVVQSSGKYYGKNDVRNETNPPEFENYHHVWAEGFRWKFLDKIPLRQTQSLSPMKYIEPAPMKTNLTPGIIIKPALPWTSTTNTKLDKASGRRSWIFHKREKK